MHNQIFIIANVGVPLLDAVKAVGISYFQLGKSVEMYGRKYVYLTVILFSPQNQHLLNKQKASLICRVEWMDDGRCQRLIYLLLQNLCFVGGQVVQAHAARYQRGY